MNSVIRVGRLKSDTGNKRVKIRERKQLIRGVVRSGSSKMNQKFLFGLR